jgi:hypothetical protein
MSHFTKHFIVMEEQDFDVHIEWSERRTWNDYEVGNQRIYEELTEYQIESVHLIDNPDVEYCFDNAPKTAFDFAVVEAYTTNQFDPRD